MAKRIICILLSLILCIGVLPFTASAEGNHAHPICGDASCSEHGDSVIYSTQIDSPYEVDANIVLTSDADCSGLTVTSGATMNLCLNGNTLNLGSGYISLSDNSKINICDCVGGGKITGTGNYGIRNSSSTVNMFGGTLETSRHGGSQTIYSFNGTVNIDGGTVTNSSIRNISSDKIHAIYNGNTGSTLTINSGTVSVVDSSSGSCEKKTIYNGGGTVIVNGGVVTLTSTENSYGRTIYNSPDGKININGGSVINTGTNVNSYAIRNDGTLTISGGIISSNGAVAISTDSILNIYGGNIISESYDTIYAGGPSTTYLGMNPSFISGNGRADIRLWYSDEIQATLYGYKKDNTSAVFCGNPITVDYPKIDTGYIGYPQEGTTVVRGNTDASLFLLSNSSYTLTPGTGENENNLIIKAVQVNDSTDSTDSGYSAGLSSLSSDVEKGDTVTVNVNATHESDSTYAASEIILTYDSGKLQFNEAASTLGNATVKNENGTISLQDYGESKHLGNGLYVFAFDTIADGNATVTLTSAAFVNKNNAAQSDLVAATLSGNTLSIIIQKSSFGVTLPNIFTGATTVTEGESYTFTQADSTNYDYSAVTATMNGQNVDVTDNGDGSYTIANVTGALVISGSRTEKAYTVSFSGNGAADVKEAATTATYNTAYSFTMPTASGWAYALDSITIGGKVYTGYSVADSVYTIPGSAINGNIAITITKTQTNAGVVVEGSGAGSASGNDTTVEVNKDYTLTITPEAGYTYTVTATMDGQPVEVIDNGNNTYTVKNVTGNLVFTVEKTVIVSGVSVAQYLSLDGTTMWLVKNTTPVADGKAPTYDGQAMFYSEEYKAYCYLVIAETLSLEDAQKKVGITDGTAATVDYETMDINGTGKLDASDAQLTYNIYKADYSSFTSDVTLEKFLMADVNGDGTVNLEDATTIVNKILN